MIRFQKFYKDTRGGEKFLDTYCYLEYLIMANAVRIFNLLLGQIGHQ